MGKRRNREATLAALLKSYRGNTNLPGNTRLVFGHADGEGGNEFKDRSVVLLLIDIVDGILERLRQAGPMRSSLWRSHGYACVRGGAGTHTLRAAAVRR